MLKASFCDHGQKLLAYFASFISNLMGPDFVIKT